MTAMAMAVAVALNDESALDGTVNMPKALDTQRVYGGQSELLKQLLWTM